MSIVRFSDMPYVDTPLGPGRALFVETGVHDTEWTCIITKTRAIVTYKQKRLRWGRNYTDGFGITDEQMAKVTELPGEVK